MGIFIRFSSLFSTARIPRVAVVARLTTTSTTSGSYGARAVSSMTKADLIKHSDAKVKRRKGLRKGRNRALEEVKQSPSTKVASPAKLIPRPRGTPAEKDSQERLEMGVGDPLYKEIREFVRVLVKKSDLDRAVPSKHQSDNEVHKIFTATTEAYPVLNKFEHGWVTAALIQGCLKNFRGRTRRLALAAGVGASGAGQHGMGADTRGSVHDDIDTDTGARGLAEDDGSEDCGDRGDGGEVYRPEDDGYENDGSENDGDKDDKDD